MTRTRSAVATAAWLVSVAATAQATETGPATEGDAEYGAYLSSECTTCHQADGEDKGIPSIVRWPEKDFVLAMRDYRAGIRTHPVMNMIAGRLGDEEIAALAAYFATLGE